MTTIITANPDRAIFRIVTTEESVRERVINLYGMDNVQSYETKGAEGEVKWHLYIPIDMWDLDDWLVVPIEDAPVDA